MDTTRSGSALLDRPEEVPDGWAPTAPNSENATPAAGPLGPRQPPPPEPPTPAPAPRRHPRYPRARIAAAVVVVGLASGAGGGYIGARVAGETSTQAVTSSATVTSSGTSNATENIAQVAAGISSSIVEVTVESGRSTSEGSGIIVRSDGVIVTNAHVVSDVASGGTLTVTLANGKTAKATVVGTDARHDIAVIKASGVSGVSPATLGTASSLHVGDTVIAVGSPLGLEGSVTSGIVSALNRTVEISDSNGSPVATSTTTLSHAIQTDASINPGNSGGALVDTAGRVVGLTTAMASINGNSGSIGIGFAIPIDTVRAVATSLMNTAA